LTRRRVNGYHESPFNDSTRETQVAYYALFYRVIDDFVARRTPYRSEHLGLVRAAHQRGEIVLAGALAEPADRALLIFRVADRRIVEDFARNDPYVTSGLVKHWEIRPWTVVVGGEEDPP
jgi:uncharacterized protein